MIIIERLNLNHCNALADIINTDILLHNQLSPSKPMTISTPVEFLKGCMDWAERKGGISYTILLDHSPIGIISLCNIDILNKSAKAGYWIASKYWNKGYTTEAFKLIIKTAREMGLAELSCSILIDNKASIALWRRQGAEMKEDNGRMNPVLKI